MKQLIRFTSLFIVLILFSQSAFASVASMRARIPQVVKLKDSGHIGEKRDGLLGVVKSSPEASKVVAEENKDRLEVYKTRASSQGHPLPTFMKVMGDERIKKEKSGRYIQDAAGSWKKK